MAEPRPISRRRVRAGIKWNCGRRTDDRHEQKVAEIAMPGARKMRVAETVNPRVGIAIARRPLVAVADLAAGICVRAELHHPERSNRAGKGMPLAARPDERIDRGIGLVARSSADWRRRDKGREEQGSGYADH